MCSQNSRVNNTQLFSGQAFAVELKIKLTMKKFTSAFKAVLFIITAVSCNNSRQTIGLEQGWDMLGEMKVNFVRDRDALEVNSSNKYTAIRFKIENREVLLNDLTVTYENGDALSPQVNEQVAAGQTSRVIELAAEGKVIKKVSFKYRTQGSIVKGRGRVIIFARRYNPGY
jgi:hypothetical protein